MAKKSKVVSILKDHAAAPALPEPMKLDELTLLKLKSLGHQARASRGELQLTQVAMQQHLAKIDPEGQVLKMNAQVQQLAQEMHKAEAGYRALVEETGKKLGIDMTKYAYDEESGVLHEIPLPGTPAAEAADKAAPEDKK